MFGGHFRRATRDKSHPPPTIASLQYFWYPRGDMISIVQTILGALLIVAILLQARGSSLGFVMGGDGNVFRTRRGVEKSLHYGTIALAILFFAVALWNAIV